ncbi:hypothetical protein V6N11_048496 [Hibiscus sabdariffa]|uniref:Uncharacterized protein n=1 Tax=Hibiscus sabdariffa TaxID=183260 RepID=A0ABR2PVI9_9ROSI
MLPRLAYVKGLVSSTVEDMVDWKGRMDHRARRHFMSDDRFSGRGVNSEDISHVLLLCPLLMQPGQSWLNMRSCRTSSLWSSIYRWLELNLSDPRFFAREDTD